MNLATYEHNFCVEYCLSLSYLDGRIFFKYWQKCILYGINLERTGNWTNQARSHCHHTRAVLTQEWMLEFCHNMCWWVKFYENFQEIEHLRRECYYRCWLYYVFNFNVYIYFRWNLIIAKWVFIIKILIAKICPMRWSHRRLLWGPIMNKKSHLWFYNIFNHCLNYYVQISSIDL